MAQVRRDQLNFVRRSWRMLLTGAAIMLVAVVPLFLTLHNSFLRGLVVGMDVTTVLAIEVACVVLATGTAPRIMGGNAETSTAHELRVLHHHGYVVIHHTGLHRGDIDHLLVGPGGVFVLETKWSGTEWDFSRDNHWVSSAVAQVSRSAQAMQLLLKRHDIPHVEPVLVLWGKAAAQLLSSNVPLRRHANGVLVLPGEHLQQWALKRDRRTLTAEQIRVVADELTAHTARRDALEVPTVTLRGLVQGLARVVGLTLVSLLAPAYVASWLPRPAFSVFVALTLIGCLQLRRAPRWRVAATGATTMLTFWLGICALDWLTKMH